jgi:hypothetical protein
MATGVSSAGRGAHVNLALGNTTSASERVHTRCSSQRFKEREGQDSSGARLPHDIKHLCAATRALVAAPLNGGALPCHCGVGGSRLERCRTAERVSSPVGNVRSAPTWSRPRANHRPLTTTPASLESCALAGNELGVCGGSWRCRLRRRAAGTRGVTVACAPRRPSGVRRAASLDADRRARSRATSCATAQELTPHLPLRAAIHAEFWRQRSMHPTEIPSLISARHFVARAPVRRLHESAWKITIHAHALVIARRALQAPNARARVSSPMDDSAVQSPSPGPVGQAMTRLNLCHDEGSEPTERGEICE